ncbi:MAG: hypothetical protein N2688_01900 [Burkholderiaceae bacterium]|nr:hypothetical protein [Burkholderiaceae bacterium]
MNAAQWWQQRSPRERWLALTVAALAAAAALDALLLAPQREELRRLTRAEQAASQRLARLQQAAEQQARAGETALRERRAALEQRRAQALRTLEEARVDPIAPERMRQQLQSILAQHAGLRIVGMQATGARPLTGEDGKPAPGGLYQHGLEVTVHGPYLDVLAYLQALERAPHRVYWRELELRVDASGVPTTRLSLFTLSREATWLRL